VHSLRFVPALALFILIQLGLYRVLSSIFFFRPEQRRARRFLAALLIVETLVLPIEIAAMKNGLQLPALVRRALIEPVLAWVVMSIPLLLGLSFLRGLVRRWPLVSKHVDTPAVIDPDPLPSAPSAVQRAWFAPSQVILPEPRRIFLARSAQVLIGSAALLAARGVAEAEQLPEVTRKEIFLTGLHPDLDGLTVLQLSDIHSGALITEERMRSFAQAAAALNADVIVFTGDLLDGSGRAAAPYTRAFENLHGKLGTFSILGNHDYYAGERFAIRALRDAGQTLLRNSGARISRGQGTIFFGGVDDPAIRDAGGSVDPFKALKDADPNEARVVLAHRPSLFEVCVSAGAQLVLSGHTHGGQIAISPRFSPARLLGPHTMGAYREGTAQLYVHRGMGVVGAAPLRLGSPPELALLTLRRV
jgi:predicted MPP superfamily phosphohydrolase